jgi:streptomycin 6-kinase
MNPAWEQIAACTREEIGPEADAWIEAVPRALPGLAERWSLTLGEPFNAETTSYVLRAERAGGTPVVLKLIYPHYSETPFAQEVAGLRMWDGAGIVRLLESNTEFGAQLLERAEPGTALSEETDERRAMEICAGVLRRMWSATIAPHQDIRPLAEQARIWAASIGSSWREAGEPMERALIDDVRQTFESLAGDLDRRGGGDVLVHGDLHHGNVLSARREPWLAIDPKPMIGEREYDVRAPLCDRREELLADPDPLGRLERRLDALLGSLAGEPLDRDRALGWAFAVEVDWCVAGLAEEGPDGDFARQLLESAKLLRRLRG